MCLLGYFSKCVVVTVAIFRSPETNTLTRVAYAELWYCLLTTLSFLSSLTSRNVFVNVLLESLPLLNFLSSGSALHYCLLNYKNILFSLMNSPCISNHTVYLVKIMSFFSDSCRANLRMSKPPPEPRPPSRVSESSVAFSSSPADTISGSRVRSPASFSDDLWLF